MPDWTAHPQSADGWLYIMQPRVVFQARVNMIDAAYPLAEITYDGVTTGAYTDLEMGMTLLLGTAAGLWNLGRIYVRGDADHVVADGTTLKIGYCSRGHNFGEVDALDNAYITVLDLFEPWRRSSRMLEDGTILKDYEWALPPYSAPVAHVGSLGGLGLMDFVDGTGYLQVNDLDPSGSYGTAANTPTVVGTDWDLKDGTVTGGSLVLPEVKFPPGYRWVSLTVTDSNGEIGLPRHFCIVALETSGTYAPKRVRRARWKLTPEGVTFSCELWERLDPADYLPGTVVMWLTEQDYGGEAVKILAFAGYLDAFQSVANARATDTERGTTLTALDVAGRMKQQVNPPSTMAREATPLNFNQMAGADIDRYVWWHLFNHSFVPMLTDFEWSLQSAYVFSSFSTPGGDLYSVCDNLARAIGYRLTMDTRGRLRMVLDPWRQPEDERDPTNAQDIDEDGWVDVARIHRPFPRQGALRCVASLISTADASTLTTPDPDINAVAPGTVEGVAVGSGQSGYRWLVFSAQEQWARLGEDYERNNAQEDPLRLVLAHGLDGGIEPADLVPVTLTASVENVGWLDDALVAERCLPLTVEFSFDDEAAAMTQVLTVERETRGAPGSFDDVAGGSTPIPGYNPIPPYDGTDLIPVELIVFDSGAAACHTALWADAETGTPVWEDHSTGLTGYTVWASANTYNYGEYYALQSTGLFFNPDPFGGGIWTLLATPTTIYGLADGLGGDLILSINRNGWMAIPCGYVLCLSTDGGVTWSQVILGAADLPTSYTTVLGIDNAKIAVSPFNNPDAVGEGRFYAGTRHSGYSMWSGDDWGVTNAVVSNPDTINGSPHPHVPYQKDTLVDNVNTDQQVYAQGWGSTNTALIRRSEDSGADGFPAWFTDSAANNHAPASAEAGHPMMSFTWDGGKYATAFTSTGAGGGSGLSIYEDGVEIFSSAILSPTGTQYNNRGWVNGYPVHKSAWMWGHRDTNALYVTLDDGATPLLAVNLPSGYSGAAYAEWSIRHLVPPPVIE